MSLKAYRTFTVLALLLGISSSALAQSTYATITGLATDANGAVVPGVLVEVVQTETNYKYTATTNDAGQYTFANIREGVYRLSAKASGFRDFAAENIVLAASDRRRVDLPLQLGAVETKVEVTAGVAQIETETARISDIKTGDYLRAMATTWRVGWYFLQLAPTATKARAGTWEMRFGGARAYQGEQTMDGISLGAGSQGNTSQQAMTLSTNRTESVQEIRIDTAGNTAEYAGIGQATFVTRSGGNELHGSAYWQYSTPRFQARNPFSPTRIATVNHAFGASNGGPVFIPKVYDGRNRTFFYYSMEWTQGSPQLALLNPTVPLASWRAGDYSGLLPGTIVRDPSADNAPFAGNRIPAARLNPVSLKFQDYYPLPNTGNPAVLQGQNFLQTVTFPRFSDPSYVGRLDHRFSPRAAVFGRISTNDTRIRTTNNGTAFPSLYLALSNDRLATTAAFSYTQTLRANLLNEFRWGLGKQRVILDHQTRGLQLAKDLGLVGLAPGVPDQGGITNLSFAGLGLTGIVGLGAAFPFENYTNMQFEDHLSWFTGRHSLKVGVQFSRPTTQLQNAGFNLFGNLTFSNRFTGHPYADFQLGIPTTAARSYAPLNNEARRLAHGYFITDEFRVSPKLTLTLGLRYSYLQPWRQNDDLISVFDIGSGKIVVPDSAVSKVNPLVPKSYVSVVSASSAGYNPTTLIGTDKNNFAPRVGLAWRPFDANTVFRAGYGLFYDVVPYRGTSAAGVPFNIAEPAYTNPAVNPNVVLPRIFPDSTSGPGTVGLPLAIRQDIRIPYSMQYTATIERQQWDTGFRISYTGTNTRQGVWFYNINQPVPDTRAYVDKPRLFPTYPAISYVTNGAGHQYHAGTVQVQSRRARKGMDFQAHYTLARDIGDLESAEAPENAFDRRRERGVWEDIPTHRAAANFIYQLPIGRGKTVLKNAGKKAEAIAGGWQFSGVYTVQSGQFLTPLWTGPDPVGAAFSATRTPPLVTIRPNHLRDANLSDPKPERWFDVSAFGPPTPGQYGSAAKGVIKGAPVNLLNLSIGKAFTIRERVRLRFQIDAANSLNHPNYFTPGVNISQATAAGVITATPNSSFNLDNAGERRVILHLRAEW